MERNLISIVIPVYNEETVIKKTHEEMKNLVKSSEENFEIIYVNDGSVDQTLDYLKEISEKEEWVRHISFSRNFGHQIAITAGMNVAKGDAIVVIDADLQDPPSVILEMIEKWKEGYDVVYGKRIKREGETIFKKMTANFFYRLLNVLSDIRIPVDTGDFRLIDKKVNDTLKGLNEKNRYIRGLISWIGFKQYPLEYVRKERAEGETKYSMRKMVKLAMDGVTSLSNLPLKMGFVIAPIIFVISFILLIFNIFIPFMSYIDILFLVLFGVLFFYLGLMGLYFGRMYDEELSRPLYIIDEENSNYENKEY